MWNPPTGPPNGVPLRPAEARREVEEAVAAACRRDADLRAEIVATAAARIHAAAGHELAAVEAADAAELAKRALERSHEAARAGQRADAARWTAAARVFAMRLRDARRRAAALEAEIAADRDRGGRATAGLEENVRRLEAVLAARMPMVPGRKGAKLQAAVDAAVAGLRQPVAEAVAWAESDARRAVAAADAAGEPAVEPVVEDELEAEVDLDGAEPILDELRAELDLDDGAAPAGRERASRARR
ncbi:MAG TPA: hypothetical protein VFI47_16910 [Acidimicrobiales bacterium]|nr:hypothetical protein [Acidimicrobiales bacterium]